MATKPPPSVEPFSPESIERLAYSIVDDIETQEPNDRNRLGYHVWIWLKDRQGTLEQAIRISGARTVQPVESVISLLKRRLAEKGID